MWRRWRWEGQGSRGYRGSGGYRGRGGRGVYLAAFDPDLTEIPSSREEIVTELVKGDGEYPVRGIKGLLNTVSMVNININIQNTGMVPAPKRRREKKEEELKIEN